MRKLPLLIVSALALTLGVAGIAQAVNSKQTIAVKLKKNKAGTAKKPRDIGKITVDLGVKVDSTDPPFATKQAVIYFDKNLVFNGAKFASCTAAQAFNSKGKPAPACNKAKVGGGKAQGLALGLREDLTVTAWNGPKGKSLLLRVQGTTPLDIDTVLVGKLQNVKGKDAKLYGKKLVVNIPENLQHPIAGATATLTRFLTTVGGVQKKTPFIALKGCTKGKLRFGSQFTFTDNTKQSPSTTARCRK